MDNKKSPLTFERFIEEADEKIKRGNNISGVIIFSEKGAWENFNISISNFNYYSKRWLAELIETYQNDFFILRFRDLKEKNTEKFFFIKVMPDNKDYITLFVLSHEDYNSFQTFKSLIRHTPGMWLGWIGSRFLERFDEFVKTMFPDFSTKLVKFVLEFRDIENKRKKGSNVNWIPRTKEDLWKLRNFHHKTYNELVYVKKGRYEITNKRVQFKLSLSDRTEFTLESGGLLEFLELFKGVLVYARELRDLFNKKISVKKYEQKVKSLIKPIEIFSIDKIELIKIEMDNPFFESWLENLVKTFSLGYINEHKLVSFVLEKGNPYFLAEIIDIENESRVFISATSKTIRISPADYNTKPSTISKLFSILQARVDPSINIGEKNGRATSS